MRHFRISHVFAMFVIALVVAAGCTKEGPAGAAGADGTNGTDGKDGVDGNATCIQCHTIDYMNNIKSQYAMSVHAAGANVSYAGGRKDCAMCHSDEGFRETQHTGLDTTASNIPIPTHIQCSTCHSFHKTLDFENDGPDYSIRQNGPVDLVMYRSANPPSLVSLDFGNNSNLCINCHQPRTAPPKDNGTGQFYIASSHYGPHHGTQGTYLQGIGGAEIGTGYPEPGSSKHTQAACTGCHMHEYANNEGGHTWDVPVASCTPCHEDATTTDINGKQTYIAGLLDELKTGLISKGIIDAQGNPVVGTYPIAQAKAYYNYAGISDDGSKGVHNYEYIKQLLVSSISAVN